jgi:hypothetical protein
MFPQLCLYGMPKVVDAGYIPSKVAAMFSLWIITSQFLRYS